MIARDTWRKFIVVAVIALVASQYLAGFGFLWWIDAPIVEASPLTVARYAYYYGDDPDLARGLWLFTVGAFGARVLRTRRDVAERDRLRVARRARDVGGAGAGLPGAHRGL